MRFFFTLILLFSFLTINGQEAQVKDVNKDIDLVRVYEQVIKEGYGTPKVFLDLANAYYFKDNFLKAKHWYEQHFNSQNHISAKIKFRYKQTLKALEEDFSNNQYLTKFNR